MITKLRNVIIGLTAVFGFGVLVFAAPTAYAQDAIDSACESDPSSLVCQDNKNNDFGSIIKIVINTLLFLVGAVSVIMVVIGGIMYTTSAGDSGAVTKAKNTIFGAVIGLVVAFLSFAIVNWVLERLFV